MTMDDKGSTKFLKDAVPSTTLMQFSAFNTLKSTFYKQKFVAGHTRYSTVGGDNWENTHPFHFGQYMGMQNGTISSDHETIVPGLLSPCEVDSASVFWSMSQQGIEETFKNYEGEGVFLFFDTKAKTFNIVKNMYRNLHRVRVENLDAYIYSTDKGALQLVIERSGLVADDIEIVPNDTLITYGIDNTYVTSHLEVPEPVYTNYGTNYWKTSTPKKQTSSTKALPPPSTGPLDIWDEEAYYDDYTGLGTGTTDSYICDCDMCGSPLHASDNIYANTMNLDKASVVSCQDCVRSVMEQTGKTLFAVSYLEKDSYKCS